MKHRNTILILTIGVLVVASVLGAGIYRNASAQAGTPPTPTDSQQTAPGAAQANIPPGTRADFGKGPKGGYNNEELASALGITVDELNAAYQEAQAAALSKAVEAGLITQAQADEISSRGAGMPFGGPKGGWLNQADIDFETLLADALGISVEQLQAAYATAFSASIDQRVADGTLTQEQADLMKGRYALYNSESFRNAMQTAYEAAVSQAVADGVITQAQADLILADQAGMGVPGFGMGGGRGGHHGGWGGGSPGLAPTR